MARTTINKLLFGTALLLTTTVLPAAATNIETNMARMQAMDKITGRVSEIDVPVNGEAKFGSFSIVVRKCVTRSPEETPENTAFVDVVDNYNPDKPLNIFKGWMMSSSPAINAVEHPIYDVWLLKCHNGETKNFKLLSAEELKARDEVPMQEVSPAPDKPTPETSAAQTEENSPATEVLEAPKAESVDAPKTQEVVSVVVGGNEDTDDSDDDGAPKALLQIETQSIDADAPAAEEPQQPEEKPADTPAETPEEDGFISFEEESEDALNAEALQTE